MYEIKCPNCGEVFQVEKAAYAEIVEQVRNEQFKAEVDAQIQAVKSRMESDQKTLLAETNQKYQQEVDKKDREIFHLKEQAKSAEDQKELAVEKAVHAEIERIQNYKLAQSTKMIGESLEVYCKREFDAVRMMAFRNAYFEKDNDDKQGTKADFVYKENAEDGTPLLSITFEMKNEADATVKKQRNDEFLKKLDDDRKKNKTEYAVLVTMLEQDNPVYDAGIVIAYQYEKMYIVRPQFFIQLISFLRDAALNNLQTRRELIKAQEQNLDVQSFGNALMEFKDKFNWNVGQAGKNFNEAIKKIDESIKQMEK